MALSVFKYSVPNAAGKPKKDEALMDTFKLIIRKQIHGCFAAVSSRDVYLQKEFDLPFAPYPGLVILHEENELTIRNLYWDSDKGRFKSYDEDDKELYNADLRNDPNRRSIEEVVQEYLDDGWEREGQ